MSDTVFGPSIDSSDVERAVLAHLAKWMPTYIGRLLRLKDPDKERWPEGIAEIRQYTVKLADNEKWPEDQLPMILVRSPGMTEKTTRHGDGQIDGKYGAVVLAIAEGAGQDPAEDARELARLYGRAASLALVQKPDMDGFANAVDMGEEDNAPISRGVEADRHLAVASCPFEIEIEGIMDADAGPDAPLEDPEVEPEDRPTVKEGGGSLRIEQGAEAVDLLREGGFFSDP